MGLDQHLLTNVGLALGVAFAVAVLLLLATGLRLGQVSACAALGTALWGGFLMALVIAMIVWEVYGFLGLFGVKLSAIPAISIIMAVGVGVEFTAHLVLAFVEARGARAARVAAALDKMYAATWHGCVSTLLGVLMLAFSGIDFIFRYFFLVYLLVVGLGALNGMLLLPALLAIAGPPGLMNDDEHGEEEQNGGGGGVEMTATATAAVESSGGAAAVVAPVGGPRTPAGPPPPLAQV